MAAVVMALRAALVAEAALRRVDPVSTSGPVGMAITTSAIARRPGRGAQVTRHGAHAAGPRRLQAAAHERRHGAGGDPDEHVARAQPLRLVPALVVAVLRPFHGAEHRVLAPGHDGADAVGVRPERRRALRGLQHAQAPAGARAQEHDAAAALQRVRDQVGRARDRARWPSGGDQRPPVLVEEQRDHARGWRRVSSRSLRGLRLSVRRPRPGRGRLARHRATLSTTRRAWPPRRGSPPPRPW